MKKVITGIDLFFQNVPIRAWIYLSVGFLLLVVTLYIVNFHDIPISKNSSDWGTFGDFFGGILGALFNVLAVILIYLTFKKQQETSVLQQFESTFFSLLDVHRDMMKSVKGQFEFHGNEKTYIGSDFFQRFAAELEGAYQFVTLSDSIEDTRTLLCEIYERHFENPGPTLGPYYRNLYHFIKYTNGSDITGQKRKYMDLIQAQMSDAELYSLFYNAICFGWANMLPLLDTYSFLENIERKTNSFDQHKRMFFPKTEFKYDVKIVPFGDI